MFLVVRKASTVNSDSFKSLISSQNTVHVTGYSIKAELKASPQRTLNEKLIYLVLCFAKATRQGTTKNYWQLWQTHAP
jgi:hypothetical protein